jgi:hypothetical protein
LNGVPAKGFGFRVAEKRSNELLEDGITRSAKVKIVNTEREKATVWRRPIQHLIPLELHIEPVTRSDVVERDNCDHVVKDQGRRPRRKAAIKGELSKRNQRDE